jgi:hypothetical protein
MVATTVGQFYAKGRSFTTFHSLDIEASHDRQRRQSTPDYVSSAAQKQLAINVNIS